MAPQQECGSGEIGINLFQAPTVSCVSLGESEALIWRSEGTGLMLEKSPQ